MKPPVAIIYFGSAGPKDSDAHGVAAIRRRGTNKKEIVVIAVEIKEPKGLGRVRMQRIPDISGANLVPFVSNVVEPGSEVHTDGGGGYNELAKRGYKHNRTVLSDSGDPAHVAMPGIHRISSLLKRWLLGTHHGLSAASIWTTTWTSTPSGTTAAPPDHAGCSSIALWSRQLRRPQCRTRC